MDYNLGALYKVWLYGLLQNGSVAQSDIDQAVSRVYRAHFMLGLLDPLEDQYYTSVGAEVVDSPAHRALALQVSWVPNFWTN